jgi:hypothetical protein
VEVAALDSGLRETLSECPIESLLKIHHNHGDVDGVGGLGQLLIEALLQPDEGIAFPMPVRPTTNKIWWKRVSAADLKVPSTYQLSQPVSTSLPHEDEQATTRGESIPFNDSVV